MSKFLIQRLDFQEREMHVFLKETLGQEQKEETQIDEDGKRNKSEIRITDF